MIAAVGYTSRACGVLVVQSPDELHLKGYPRSKVKCTYSVCAEGAERRHIQVERFLVQLGFADQVRMSPAGEELVVGITMTKMQAKCSGHRGWQEGSAPAGMLASWLDKVTPSVAYAEIQARMDSAFTFMCHSDFCDTVLRASGTEGIFTKVHQSCQTEPLELFVVGQQDRIGRRAISGRRIHCAGARGKGATGYSSFAF